MRRTSPNKFWNTFKNLTSNRQEDVRGTPDAQWLNWHDQGYMVEEQWDENLLVEAELFVDQLCNIPLVDLGTPAPTPAKVQCAKRMTKPGRAAGPDGIGSDVPRKLRSLTYALWLIMPIVFQKCLCSTGWGLA